MNAAAARDRARTTKSRYQNAATNRRFPNHVSPQLEELAVPAAIVKGAIIGIAYVIIGVPHPLLFAALTMVLAMVPLEAWVAVAMAALTLVVQDGSMWAPTGLSVFGAATLLIGDNFILPALIGGTAVLPFLMVPIRILGGL